MRDIASVHRAPASASRLVQRVPGLSSAEVSERRARGEGNSAPPPTGRTYATILRENVFTFINNVLFLLCIALILLGEISDAIVAMGVVIGNVLVSVAQEVRAKR